MHLARTLPALFAAEARPRHAWTLAKSTEANSYSGAGCKVHLARASCTVQAGALLNPVSEPPALDRFLDEAPFAKASWLRGPLQIAA